MNIIKGIFKFIGIYLILVIFTILVYTGNVREGLDVSLITICLLTVTLFIVVNYEDVFKSKLSYYKLVIFHILSLFTIIAIMFVFTYIVKEYNEHIPYRVLYHNTTKIIK